MHDPDTDTLACTALWFERAVPEPISKNVHTQLGCHLEEVCEMLHALSATNAKTGILLADAEARLKALADHLKASDSVIVATDPSELLDAICDQIVTATGIGHMFGYDTVGAMQNVNASNWSKFVKGQPVFNANLKIQKGPGYFKPNLEPFLVLNRDKTPE